MLALGVLVFVCGTLLVLSAWRVVDATFGASAAAREATRAFVEHSGTDASARARAEVVGHATVDAHGLDPGSITAVDIEGALQRCTRVRVEIRYRVPALVIPWLHGIGSVDVVGDHSELVDPLRSTVPGEARCLG